MLSDIDIYIAMNRDPTSSLVKKTQVILKNWEKREYISRSTYRKLYCSNGTLPRVYASPEIHKERVCSLE